MECLQYSIQTLDPNLFGMPTADAMMKCGSYGIQDGHDDTYLCNAVTGDCAEIVPDDGSWISNVAGLQTGTHTTWVMHTFTADEANGQYLFGIRFLPWGTQVYKRTDINNLPFPYNPFNHHTIMEKSLTVAKLGGMLVATYYGGKMMYKIYKKRYQ